MNTFQCAEQYGILDTMVFVFVMLVCVDVTKWAMGRAIRAFTVKETGR